MRIATIIPALDEEAAIGGVVRAISRQLVHEVIVVDNGSRDGTAAAASAAGATVIREPQRGYGAACQAGARPKISPVSSDTTRVNPNTCRSTLTSPARGMWAGRAPAASLIASHGNGTTAMSRLRTFPIDS